VGNLRREERIPANLQVNLGDLIGVTRDISASGISFETTTPLALGEAIKFTVNFEGHAGKMVLKCVGQIVRAESLGAGMKIAVQIAESTMEVA